EHPLVVYLPCGVGGAPGCITFGLKQLFGEHVHCFCVEPVQAPSVLLGLLTGEKEKVSVQDFGISNRTEADGLAVGRPSKFATIISEQLISGIYTIEDKKLFQLLAMLADSEDIYVEPSAAAGLVGPIKILQSSYNEDHHIQAENATHIVWASGGGLVAESDMQQIYQKGKEYYERSILERIKMKIVIAPDSFKESMTALEAANAIEKGFKRIIPQANYVKVPMADGGEGTVQSLVDATHGETIKEEVTGPLGSPVEAFYGVSGDGRTAVIEMAAASGLHLVPEEKRNPLITTTKGTGELVLAAMNR